MQKKYALFLEVLKKFSEAGILDETVLIGSWCMHFYRTFFSDVNYHPTIRTRDIDFLVPLPMKTKNKVDIAGLLESDGFIVTHNAEGFMRLEHPDLIIEFLVPERGRGSDKPYPIPSMGVNAQPLRFLDYLAKNSSTVSSEGLKVRIPNPAAFALHKLIISSRRKTEDKIMKERREALTVLRAMISEGMEDTVIITYGELLPSWKKKVLAALDQEADRIVYELLVRQS